MVITDDPSKQLENLAEIFKNPRLPRGDLARMLQLRMAWHPLRGLPAAAAYTYGRMVAAFVTPAPTPAIMSTPAPTPTIMPTPAYGPRKDARKP